eukprot:5193437-Alexandrium_andersonii.AAC.1
MQPGAQRTLALFGLPGTLHPGLLVGVRAVLPDARVIANRSEAEILICAERAEPSCNVWHERRILRVLGIW